MSARFYKVMEEHGWHHNPEFPGLYSNKVDMAKYNNQLPLIDRRQLQYYSAVGPMPSLEEDPNLHACVHLYASDRNSLFGSANLLGIGDGYSHMASLAHTVILHGNPEDLSCSSGDATDNKWFCQEAWAPRNGNGRVLHESRMWDEDGKHIATIVQDGLLRLGAGARKEKMREDFEDVMREKTRKGKL
jgi:acyl-CoA thioesterase